MEDKNKLLVELASKELALLKTEFDSQLIQTSFCYTYMHPALKNTNVVMIRVWAKNNLEEFHKARQILTNLYGEPIFFNSKKNFLLMTERYGKGLWHHHDVDFVFRKAINFKQQENLNIHIMFCLIERLKNKEAKHIPEFTLGGL
ncbi:MAG: hypothetical protein FWD32_00550 [Firmicutes bacterium]|nr:hypothetical protein [Bacillota bacterium]